MNQSINNQSIHSQSIHNQSINSQSMVNQSIHNQSVLQHGGNLFQSMIPTVDDLYSLLITHYLYVVGILVILMLVIWRVRKYNSSTKNTIAILGERYSGKTQLFISLNNGMRCQTIPSIKNNTTSKTIRKRLFKIIDYCGDDISKEEVLSNLKVIKCIIQVIDGSELDKTPNVASFIYRLLVNTHYQQSPSKLILFLNKKDSPNYAGRQKILKRIEDEVEHIKVSRKNQMEEKQNQDDYLKISKTRFSLANSPIIVLEGSAKANLQELQNLLTSIV